MTFSSQEKSIDDGQPLELFRFVMRPKVWRYSNHTEDVSVGPDVYLPNTISRTTITQTEEINKADLTITVPRYFGPADRFRVVPPSEPMVVTVSRMHFGTEEPLVAWQGRVMSVGWSGAKAEMVCQPIFSSLLRPGMRRYYSYVCGHSLYGPKCRVIANAHVQTALVTSVVHSKVGAGEFGAHADGHFTGGYIQYTTAEGIVEQRLIVSHVGTLITLAVPPVDLRGAMRIQAFPGCAHTTDICASKFDNLNNYGGFPYIPTGTPFAGKTIF